MSLAQPSRVRDYRDLVIEDQAAELHDTKADLETVREILSVALSMIAKLSTTCERQRDHIAHLRAASDDPQSVQAAA